MDYIYRGPDIVAGPCSAITGPVEEFSTNEEGLGFSDASPGGTFLKIGVGVLRKPDNAKYSMFRLYDIVDHGTWAVHTMPASIVFTQRVMDPSSGYGYLYQKTVRLVAGKPQMVIEHRLTNIGKRPIVSSVYDHNFLVLDNQAIGPDFTITLPFEIHPAKPVNTALGSVDGKTITYLKQMQGRDHFRGGHRRIWKNRRRLQNHDREPARRRRHEDHRRSAPRKRGALVHSIHSCYGALYPYVY